MISAKNPYRIMFVTPCSPFSSATGAEQRSGNMLRALQMLGRVDVVQVAHGRLTQARRILQDGVEWVDAQVHGANWTPARYQPKHVLTKAVEAQLGANLGSFDLVVGRYAWPVCQLEIPSNVPVLVDLDDYQYRCSGKVKLSLAWLKMRLVKWLANRWVRGQLHRFAGVFVASPQDQALLIPVLPTVLLPNVALVFGSRQLPRPVGKKVIFVGSLWYVPNAQGVNWFLRHVWPQVRQAQPDATLTLVGTAAKSVRAAWQAFPGISAPGFVDDLQAAYQSATLVIVPVQCGGGSNIKVLEALAYAKPCVASRFSAAAFEPSLKPEEHLLVAVSAQEFAARVIEVLSQPNRFEKMAHDGQTTVQAKFGHEQFYSVVKSFTERFLGV